MLRIVEQRRQARRERVDVADLDEVAGLALGDELGEARPTLVVDTGSPCASASRNAIPYASRRVGRQKTDARS